MISESGNSDPDHDAVPVTRSAPGIRFRGSVISVEKGVWNFGGSSGIRNDEMPESSRHLFQQSVLADAFKTGAGSESEKSSSIPRARSSVPVLILKAVLM